MRPFRALRLSLRWHLLLLVCAVLLPMIGFSVVLGLRLSAKERAEIHTRLLERARDVAAAVDREALAVVGGLRALAESEELRRNDLAGFHVEAARVVGIQPAWLTVILADPRGRQLVNAARPFGAGLPHVLEPESFRTAIESRTPVVGAMRRGERWGIPVRVPIVRGRDVPYVLTAVLAPDAFARALLRDIVLPPGGGLMILDQAGALVGGAGDVGVGLGQPPADEIRAAITVDTEAPRRIARASDRTTLTVVAARADFARWSVVLTTPTALVDASWRQSMTSVAGAGLVMLALSAAAAIVLARRIASPLRSATTAARALTDSETPELRASSVDEVARLTTALGEARARLRQTAAERERAEARLAVVGDIARSITSSLDLDGVLQAIVAGARRLCASDTAAIFLRDGESDAMVPHFRVGPRPVSYETLAVHPGEGVAGQVLLTGAPVRTQHYQADARVPGEFRELGAQIGAVALMAVPIAIGGRVEGLLYLSNESARAFTDEDERVSLRLADQAAIAIVNARLFGRERAARADAETAHAQAALLARASSVLSSSLETDALLAEVARVLVPEVADGCAVDVVAGDTVRRIAILHHDRAREEAGRQLARRYPPGPGHPVVEVVRTGQPHLVTDTSPIVNRLARDDEHRRLLEAADLGSVLIVPLKARREVIGAFTLVAGRARRPFAASDVDFAQDLAQRVAYALENARLYRESEEANRAKDAFLAMLGHELRNPLGAIRAAVSLLDRASASADATRRAREVVARQVAHLADLVDDLLDVARVSMGKIALSRAPLDLAEAVQRCLAVLDARHHEITVETEPVWIDGDLTRVEQMITNIVENAVKYTPAGGHVRVTVTQDDQDGILTVTDDGIGIAPELLSRIFDLFTQGEQRPHRPQGGLGIGLTLVRRLAELHGGSVEARSEGRGRGSTFTLRLPRAMRAAPAAPPPPPSPTAARKRRVLVVEDNADARDMLHRLLELGGHEVYEAEDGPGGLEAAIRHDPDVVLMDIGLPGFDGYELARRLRASATGRRVRLIAVTGYGAPDDRRRAAEAGCDAHLVKPVDPDRLAALIEADA